MLGLGSLCRCRGDRVKERLITQQKSLDKAKEASYKAKEAYIHRKRGLYTQQKRPTYAAKEAYIHSKRGLYTKQKRPNKQQKRPVPMPRGSTAMSSPHSTVT